MLCLQAVLMVEYSELLANVFLVICATSLLFKLLYFISIGQPTGVSISSATGFSQAKVNLLDSGHSSGTFLTDEFVFQASAKKISMLRIVSVVMAFLLPFALLFFESFLLQREFSHLKDAHSERAIIDGMFAVDVRDLL